MPEFVTCLNCMDGRVQLPAISWLKEKYDAKYVDMITAAGMDGYISRHGKCPDEILERIDISVNKHGSNQIFIVGHHDCGGHPVSEQQHRQDVEAAVEIIKNTKPDCRVTGLWISDKWQVEKTVEK